MRKKNTTEIHVMMNKTKSKINNSLIISVPESFGMNFYRELRNAYLNTSGRYNKYIIDLRKTDNMSTCMLGMLLQMHEYLERDNSEIHLINCNSELLQLLKVSSLYHLFHVSSQ